MKNSEYPVIILIMSRKVVQILGFYPVKGTNQRIVLTG